MKRLLIAALLAVAIHVVVFSIDGNWFDSDPGPKTRTKPIRLSLVYPPVKQIQKTEPLPVSHVLPPQKKKRAEPIEQKKIIPPPRRVTKKKKRPVPETLKPVDRPANRPVVPPTKYTADPPGITSPSTDQAQTEPAAKPNPADTFEQLPVAPPNESPEAVPVKDKGLAVSNRSMEKQLPSTNDLPPATATIQEAVPLYKDNPPPIYPRKAQKRGYQGAVFLDVLVTRDGRVKEVKISQSSRHAVLDRAAVDSVRKWRFEPGKRGDEKVDMWVKVPIQFRLDE